MSESVKVICDKQELVNIADAIREKAGTSDALAFSAMADVIAAIEAGGGNAVWGTTTLAEESANAVIPNEAIRYEGNTYPKIALMFPIVSASIKNPTSEPGGVLCIFEDNQPLKTSGQLKGVSLRYGKLNGTNYFPYRLAYIQQYGSGISCNAGGFSNKWAAGTSFIYGCIW